MSHSRIRAISVSWTSVKQKQRLKTHNERIIEMTYYVQSIGISVALGNMYSRSFLLMTPLNYIEHLRNRLKRWDFMTYTQRDSCQLVDAMIFEASTKSCGASGRKGKHKCIFPKILKSDPWMIRMKSKIASVQDQSISKGFDSHDETHSAGS